MAGRLARIREHLAAAVATSDRREVVYRTEWLGFLPFGTYQWIELDAGPVTVAMPPEWELDDLLALEAEGFLERLGEWTDPHEPADRRITYRVRRA